MILFAEAVAAHEALSSEEIRELFSSTLNDAGINPGSVAKASCMFVRRKFRPDLMGVMQILTPKKSSERILHSLDQLKDKIRN